MRPPSILTWENKNSFVHRSQSSYHEKLLHWIWKTARFDSQQLQTVSGEKVHIHQFGQPNKTDGPDFTGAEITIGDLRWYGDVEIHWKITDWQSHTHEVDPRYNNVILHVVFQETGKNIRREDQSKVPTLWLGQYLPEPLESFLTQYLTYPQLPCAQHLSYISEEAFLQQIEKAHREYFEQKINDQLAYYDPALPPSESWVKLLGIAFFDGMGISHNREPMRRLCRRLYNKIENYPSADAVREAALSMADLYAPRRAGSSIQWNHKGCRPANHPKHRIQQAALGLWYIYRLPFEQWINGNPKKIWANLVASIDITPSVGKERSSILFGTVFLPALYSLGNLFHIEKLKDKSWRLWQDHRASLPGSLLEILNKTDLDPGCYRKKLGTIYHLRNYCNAGRCHQCFVFKSAISS